MKTLDEVIAYFDNQTQQRHVYLTEDAEDIYNDVLHYLKEYRALELAYIKAMADLEDNQPLTWQEIQQMEGKPVWVEQCNGDTKGWLLILRTNFDIINCTTKHGNSFYLYKSSYGERWQAYRKEKK